LLAKGQGADKSNAPENSAPSSKDRDVVGEIGKPSWLRAFVNFFKQTALGELARYAERQKGDFLHGPVAEKVAELVEKNGYDPESAGAKIGATATAVVMAARNPIRLGAAAKEAAAVTELTAAQLKNVERFMGKVPANAKESFTVRALPNEGVAVQAVSPGRVPGSSAVYEKQIDATGKTIQYAKSTYDPAGNIVHVKDKISGGVFP